MDKYLESQGLKSDGTPLNSNEEVKRGEEAANLQLLRLKLQKLLGRKKIGMMN